MTRIHRPLCLLRLRLARNFSDSCFARLGSRPYILLVFELPHCAFAFVASGLEFTDVDLDLRPTCIAFSIYDSSRNLRARDLAVFGGVFGFRCFSLVDSRSHSIALVSSILFV